MSAVAALKAEAAEKTGIAKGQRQLERGFRQTSQQFDPFIGGGQQAFQQQAAFSGAAGPEAQAQAFQQFQASPGQQFLQQRAEKALLRNAAATGNLGGGATQQALQEQAIGFAQQDFGNQFARLGQVVQPSIGFTSQLGGFRQGRDVNVANLQTQAGQAEAQRIRDIQAASGSGLGTAIELGSAAFGVAGGGGNPFLPQS